MSDAELDVGGADEAIYGSLAAPTFKVVQRCLYSVFLFYFLMFSSLINLILSRNNRRYE